MPILGGDGANKAMIDSIDLAEHLSKASTTKQKEFLKKRHEELRRAMDESDWRLCEMHGLNST